MSRNLGQVIQGGRLSNMIVDAFSADERRTLNTLTTQLQLTLDSLAYHQARVTEETTRRNEFLLELEASLRLLNRDPGEAITTIAINRNANGDLISITINE